MTDVTEKLSHGTPAFFVRKQFVTLWPDGHHEHRFAHLWCAAPTGAQDEFVDIEPERFFRPPYVGGRGWLGVRLDGDIDWGEVVSCLQRRLPHGGPDKAGRKIGRRRGLTGRHERRVADADHVTPTVDELLREERSPVSTGPTSVRRCRCGLGAVWWS